MKRFLIHVSLLLISSTYLSYGAEQSRSNIIPTKKVSDFGFSTPPQRIREQTKRFLATTSIKNEKNEWHWDDPLKRYSFYNTNDDNPLNNHVRWLPSTSQGRQLSADVRTQEHKEYFTQLWKTESH